MKKTEVECCDITCIHDDKVRAVRQRMPEEERLKELADFYKVFADATRIRDVRLRPGRESGDDPVGHLASA